MDQQEMTREELLQEVRRLTAECKYLWSELEVSRDHYAELRELIDDGGELTHAQALEELRERDWELAYQRECVAELKACCRPFE